MRNFSAIGMTPWARERAAIVSPGARGAHRGGETAGRAQGRSDVDAIPTSGSQDPSVAGRMLGLLRDEARDLRPEGAPATGGDPRWEGGRSARRRRAPGLPRHPRGRSCRAAGARCWTPPAPPSNATTWTSTSCGGRASSPAVPAVAAASRRPRPPGGSGRDRRRAVRSRVRSRRSRGRRRPPGSTTSPRSRPSSHWRRRTPSADAIPERIFGYTLVSDWVAKDASGDPLGSRSASRSRSGRAS